MKARWMAVGSRTCGSSCVGCGTEARAATTTCSMVENFALGAWSERQGGEVHRDRPRFAFAAEEVQKKYAVVVDRRRRGASRDRNCVTVKCYATTSQKHFSACHNRTNTQATTRTYAWHTTITSSLAPRLRSVRRPMNAQCGAVRCSFLHTGARNRPTQRASSRSPPPPA